ncbi:MAG: hypothetical protein JSS96_01010 [Bacteroidetes bacterium]|nr:hypothetical protein [Bacteroidota bacterium]
MNRLFLLIIFLMLAANYSYAQSGGGLAVNPATIDFTLGAGQTAIAKLQVSNTLKERKSFKIYIEDFYRDSLGRHIYQKSGTFAHSCANWVSLDKPFVDLQPNESVTLNIRMTVPDSPGAASEMKWCMLFLETVNEMVAPMASDVKRAAAINDQMRMGVHIYQTPPLMNKEIKMLAFKSVPNEKGHYILGCQNTGGTQMRVSAYLELSPLDGVENAKKIKVGPKRFPVFPEQKRYVELVLPNDIPKGKYTIVGALDAGSDVPLAASQAVIEVK